MTNHQTRTLIQSNVVFFFNHVRYKRSKKLTRVNKRLGVGLDGLFRQKLLLVLAINVSRHLESVDQVENVFLGISCLLIATFLLTEYVIIHVRIGEI